LSDELALSPRGTIAADRVEFRTSHPKVFAGGDAVRGPSTLIEAISDGQQAAFVIERFLTGASAREEHLRTIQEARRVPRYVPLDRLEEEIPRVAAELVPADARVRSFAEVVQTITAEQACREAGRCLRCDLEH